MKKNSEPITDKHVIHTHQIANNPFKLGTLRASPAN